ncbi:MAG: DUF481 domain-containing protein, partial [Deltaproteobacteria bacterium]|nr:DUF481 domain-containing protein [Deltaproteobacteria bacterium]
EARDDLLPQSNLAARSDGGWHPAQIGRLSSHRGLRLRGVLTPSTLLGWQVFDLARFEWKVEAGVGYQYTNFISVEPLQEPSVSDAAIRLWTSFKWDILSDLDLKFQHDTILVPTDMGQTSHYTRAILKYELTDLLKLETTFVHSRIWQPVPTADGTQPKSDDFQLIVGFAFEVY